MKPSNSSIPGVRITCQVIRFWSSVRREDAPPSRHLETCESCRRFLVSTDQLQLSLRHGAGQARSTPPPEMEQRIIEALRLSRPPSPRESHRTLLTFSLAGCAVALVLAGAWSFNLVHFPGSNPGVPGEYTSDVAALVAAVRSIPADLGRNLEAPTAQLTGDNSLGREVENVYSDARSALDFLALNFLPASPPDSHEAESPRQT